MGLDMSLYRVIKPDDISEGAWISIDEQRNKFDGTEFFRADRVKICETVQRIAVRCIAENQRYLPHFALHDMFRVLGLSDETAWIYTRSFKNSGVLAWNGEFTFGMKTEFAEVQELLQKCGADAGLPAEQRRKITLENTMHYGLECELAKPDYVRVKFLNSNEKKSYAGKYIRSEWFENYAFRLEELAYQRNGLNDEGGKLLTESAELCDDRERVRQLVERGGLAPEFIGKWIDGCTVLNAWW